MALAQGPGSPLLFEERVSHEGIAVTSISTVRLVSCPGFLLTTFTWEAEQYPKVPELCYQSEHSLKADE